jgi:hypothetical protein
VKINADQLPLFPRLERSGWRGEVMTGVDGTPERRGAAGIAELHPAASGHAQRLFGASGERLALLLRHQRHDADRQVVRVRQVHLGERGNAVWSVIRRAASDDRRSAPGLSTAADRFSRRARTVRARLMNASA